MPDQWALVTGASAGLGAEFARQLAARGKNLLLVARRVEPMERLGDELREANNIDVTVFAADMSDASAPAQIQVFANASELQIDYLINNAGTAPPDLIRDGDWSAHNAYLDLMLVSVAEMCHRFIPPMRERGFGKVLNVASVAGLISLAEDYSYGPTKSYLVALSRALSKTFKADGVDVTALCPGFTHTDFHATPKLTEMKNGMPGFLWYDADVVVRDGLNALEKGREVCVSGRLYRYLLVPLMRTRLAGWLAARLNVRRGLSD